MKNRYLVLIAAIFAVIFTGVVIAEEFWIDQAPVILSTTVNGVTNTTATAVGTNITGYARDSIRFINTSGTTITLYDSTTVQSAKKLAVLTDGGTVTFGGSVGATTGSGINTFYAQASSTAAVALVTFELWGKGPAVIR